MKNLFFVGALALICFACQNKEKPLSTMSVAFQKTPRKASGSYDLDDMKLGGELLVGMISSPDIYYEYRNMPMGLQYAAVEKFAEHEGIHVRVEVARDTMALFKLLAAGTIDMIGFPVSKHRIDQEKALSAGLTQQGGEQTWAVRKDAPELAAALDDWFDEKIIATLQREQTERFRHLNEVHRRPQAVFLSRSQGVISIYDDLFKRASQQTGWDWRLIAAQCYQESGFDPNARSWAGARGLMQLMPKTAESLGVLPDVVHHPETNVAAAARYIAQLSGMFRDIRNSEERTKFVLAAYNGGAGHIRDAMALAQKNGRNAQLWGEVATYVLALQNPKYYRDPVVRYGYMIGSETANYVHSIMERFRGYGGSVSQSALPTPPHPTDALSQPPSDTKAKRPAPAQRKNKYSSGVELLSPDDPRFNQMH